MFRFSKKNVTKSSSWFEFYLVKIKATGSLHQIFVAFLNNLNFNEKNI